MDIEEKRHNAKALGIKHTHNMKEATLDKKIAGVMGGTTLAETTDELVFEELFDAMSIDTKEYKRHYLRSIDFSFTRLKQYALEMGGTKLIYKERLKAFECYREERLLDNLSITMFN